MRVLVGVIPALLLVIGIHAAAEEATTSLPEDTVNTVTAVTQAPTSSRWFLGGTLGLRYFDEIGSVGVRNVPAWSLLGGYSWQDWSAYVEALNYEEITSSGNLRVDHTHREMNVWAARRLGGEGNWHLYVAGALGAASENIKTRLAGHTDQRKGGWQPQMSLESGIRMELGRAWIAPYGRLLKAEKNPELEWALGLQLWLRL